MIPLIVVNAKIHKGSEGQIKMTTNRFSNRYIDYVDVKHQVFRDVVSEEQHGDDITKIFDEETVSMRARF